jgi:drug/metabolite transporter (DMT)-like permease
MPARTSSLPAIIGLLVAMLLWGSSFIALKVAFNAYTPMSAIFARLFVGSLFFLSLLPKWKDVSYQKGDWKLLLLMALFEPCFYFIFEAHALKCTTASQAGMVTAILPLLVAIIARIVLKEKVRKKTIVGFSLAIAGVCWLSLTSEISAWAPCPMRGNFLEFLAMVCAAGYTICVKYLSRRYNAMFLGAIQSFLGTIFFAPFLLFSAQGIPDHFPLWPTVSIIYLGCMVTFVAYTLYNYGVSKIPASQASAFVYLIPVFAIMFGWLILDEKFTWLQSLGVGFIFLGVFLSQDRRKNDVIVS